MLYFYFLLFIYSLFSFRSASHNITFNHYFLLFIDLFIAIYGLCLFYFIYLLLYTKTAV